MQLLNILIFFFLQKLLMWYFSKALPTVPKLFLCDLCTFSTDDLDDGVSVLSKSLSKASET